MEPSAASSLGGGRPPVLILGVCAAGAALMSPLLGWGALVLLAVGVAMVVLWVHWTITGTESTCEASVTGELPAAGEPRRVALAESHATVQRSVRDAAGAMLRLQRGMVVLTAVGIALMLLVRQMLPVLGHQLDLRIPIGAGAGVLGVCLAAVGWGVFRLRRLAAAAGRTLTAHRLDRDDADGDERLE